MKFQKNKKINYLNRTKFLSFKITLMLNKISGLKERCQRQTRLNKEEPNENNTKNDYDNWLNKLAQNKNISSCRKWWHRINIKGFLNNSERNYNLKTERKSNRQSRLIIKNLQSKNLNIVYSIGSFKSNIYSQKSLSNIRNPRIDKHIHNNFEI